MDVPQIVEALNTNVRTLPAKAIESAEAQRDALVPLFIRDFERFTSTQDTQLGLQALFVAFHLLGGWREKSAYRQLAKFLRLPETAVESILGQAITETIHRPMAAVFDGDPEPIYEIIRDEQAFEFVRSAMMYTLVMLTLSGELPRPQAAQFLRDCFDEFGPDDNYVWVGWAHAVAWLGLEDMVPLVEQVFARGSIDPFSMSLEDFKETLRDGPDHQTLAPFTNAREELAVWYDSDRISDVNAATDHLFGRIRDDGRPARNPFRDVGRNDPCPCGSGKKFKKCCYGIDPDELMERLAS
jgi:hypothetical protein